MKKAIFNISSLITIIILIIGCQKNNESTQKTDVLKDGFNGQVKSCKLVKFEVVKKFGEYKKSKKMVYSINNFVSYHKSGDKMNEYYFANSDIFYGICAYAYDENKKLIKKTFKDGKGQLESLIKYSEKGSLKNTIQYDKFGKEEFEIEEHLKNNLIVKEIKWKYYNGKKSKKPDYIKIFEYDGSKRLIKEAELDLWIDSQNNKEKKTTFHKYKNDEIIETIKQEHCGLFLQTDYNDSALQVEKTTFKYNKLGDVTSSITTIKYPLNKKVRSSSFSVLGNNSKQKSYRFIYTYDNNNNWTRMIEIKDGKPYCLTERDIVYYN